MIPRRELKQTDGLNRRLEKHASSMLSVRTQEWSFTWLAQFLTLSNAGSEMR